MKKYENPEIRLMNVSRDIITASETLAEDLSSYNGYDAYGSDIFSALNSSNN